MVAVSTNVSRQVHRMTLRAEPQTSLVNRVTVEVSVDRMIEPAGVPDAVSTAHRATTSTLDRSIPAFGEDHPSITGQICSVSRGNPHQ